jgi:hypothetical protein
MVSPESGELSEATTKPPLLALNRPIDLSLDAEDLILMTGNAVHRNLIAAPPITDPTIEYIDIFMFLCIPLSRQPQHFCVETDTVNGVRIPLFVSKDTLSHPDVHTRIATPVNQHAYNGAAAVYPEATIHTPHMPPCR